MRERTTIALLAVMLGACGSDLPANDINPIPQEKSNPTQEETIAVSCTGTEEQKIGWNSVVQSAPFSAIYVFRKTSSELFVANERERLCGGETNCQAHIEQDRVTLNRQNQFRFSEGGKTRIEKSTRRIYLDRYSGALSDEYTGDIRGRDDGYFNYNRVLTCERTDPPALARKI
jgi:hypothetical protein